MRARALAEFELDPSMPVGKAMVAGATAGVMEHCFMYPVDTIKSLVQADAAGTRTIAQVLRSESVPRLYRGMGAVVAGAVPSHAVQFGAYEVAKEAFGGNREGHHPLYESRRFFAH
jgi:solute carrier family 25 iron transporter 28/37